MSKNSAATRHRDPDAIALDPLEYWLAQERQPLPDLPLSAADPTCGLPDGGPPAGAARAAIAEDAADWPAGWWLVPGLLAALPVWAVIGWWLFG